MREHSKSPTLRHNRGDPPRDEHGQHATHASECVGLLHGVTAKRHDLAVGVTERAHVAKQATLHRDAFGAAPTHFSFPGEWATPAIVPMLRDEFHFTHVRSLIDGLLHRIYHCDDAFCGSAAFMCRDWAVDWF